MERCRWNEKMIEDNYKKYIFVNIPAFMLWAVDGKEVLPMRICCGAVKTKTPLLTSEIVRMELNPNWNVPFSIAKGIAGSIGYMNRNNMFIYDVNKGRLPASSASRERILSGKQRIVQNGGPGNSLGRIVFRFQNNFSVYLHHTSSPWHFQSANRAVSHGCVRVEKPYELAVFLLKDKDEELAKKIKYSMTYTTKKDSEGNPIPSSVAKDSLVKEVSVVPHVPVFLSYYTLYPDNSGNLVSYPDVYGYDKRIIEQLKPYAKRR
jgi:murein L,D-transpeptidase YcbB/YkuD